LQLLPFFGGAVLMHSCSKQELANQPVTINQETIMSEADLEFQNKLVQFRDKMNYIHEHPVYKSGEVMDMDSVVWYIEALFNAVYAYPDEVYGQTVTDTTTLKLEVDVNGFVSFNELSIKYDDLYEIIKDYYINSGISDKGFVLLDLELTEVTGNEATIAVRSVTGEKSSAGSGFDYFGEEDDWL
ncbi:MAG: hypothetical protein GY706_02035, partial [Bacteroides sp.]|nr:hypothetical protein [Bacteroides sp.]